MNTDEAMSEHYPELAAEPRSDPATSDSQQQSKAGAWNTKKWREEYDIYRSRLQDQKFSVADFPDPLAPRAPHPKQYPKGTDRELEAKLQGLIAQLKAGPE